MTTYTIRKGKKNYRPLEPPWPIWKPKGFHVRFRIHTGSWASEEEWGKDKDRNDWMKIAGLTSFLTPNDHRSCLAVMNYGKQPETWNVAPYTNFPGGHWHGEASSIIIPSMEWAEMTCDLEEEGKVKYFLQYKGKSVSVREDFVKRMLLARRIGTWAGGSNNSPGPHGGRAFKDGAIDIEFTLLK